MTDMGNSGNDDSSQEKALGASGGAGTMPRSGKLLRRAEAARLLGISKSTLRRMEGDELTPVVGPKNVHMFEEEKVHALVVTRRSSFGLGTGIGGHAADTFALFDAGEHPADVVKRLRLDPDLVETLHSKWARMRGVVVFSAQGRARMNQILSQNHANLGSEAEVLAFLSKWVVEGTGLRCVQCESDWAEFCRECAKEWGLRQARLELKAQHRQRL